MLANLLAFQVSTFETSQDVPVFGPCHKCPAGTVASPAEQLSNAVKAVPLRRLQLVSRSWFPIYQLDGLVRRSTSLQLTADARMAREGVARMIDAIYNAGLNLLSFGWWDRHCWPVLWILIKIVCILAPLMGAVAYLTLCGA